MHQTASHSLNGLLLDVAMRHAANNYLVFYGEGGAREVWTFGEFLTGARQLASLLEQYGLRPGDRVATVANNRPEVLLTYFACWLSGLTACPINIEESYERKSYILSHSRCKVALVGAAFHSELEQLRSAVETLEHLIPFDELMSILAGQRPIEVQPLPLDTSAFLVYTSGTTGDPKGVLLSHLNLLSNAKATAEWHDLRQGEGVMTVLPIHHVNGAVVTGLASYISGAFNVLNVRFSPGNFWQRLADERVAIASVVPTILEFLLSADETLSPYDLSYVRYLLCGAGPLLGETVTRFEERFGVPICHGYGMSESTAYNTQFPMELPDRERRSWYTAFGYPSIGCSLSCNEVTILREDGSEAERLERGQIALRGPAVMRGYENNSRANDQAFRDGWFLSGDQGFFELDETGRRFFFLSGRIKELIIRGGSNLSPVEIDEVLRRFPGVQFGLAVPFENTYYGEEIAAYVVPEEGATLEADAVLEFAREHLSFAMRPKVILLGSEVPFTTTGKPKRVALAAQLAEKLRPYREVQFREVD